MGETLLSSGTTVAKGLFLEDGSNAVGNSGSTFSCRTPGSGTAQVAMGPGGCLNAQPGIQGFTGTKPQTVMSFLVQPCGVVAPHNHANAVEVNTVIKGKGIIAQLTTNTNKLQISMVEEGDSFVFAEGAYHWWMNLGKEQLVTVGVFTNTDSPDAALVAFDDGKGVIGSLMGDMSLLNLLVGKSSGVKTTVDLQDGQSPLFPQLTASHCEKARQQFQSLGSSWQTVGSFQKNPSGTSLYKASELQEGKFEISDDSTPLKGPGGGLRPLAGVVSNADKPPGSESTEYDGGLTPTKNGGGPPAATLWPGFTNLADGKALVKFVVGYCGTVAIHTHVNAAEWNTVISGEGQVSYYQVNTGVDPQLITINVKKGDTFVFPKGSPHWWVNYSPTETLATIGGFTAPFPDTSLLAELFSQTNAIFPSLTDAVLGDDFKATPSSSELFPLLTTRSPSDCGGNVPCRRCY